jgi:hypothetical protein
MITTPKKRYMSTRYSVAGTWWVVDAGQPKDEHGGYPIVADCDTRREAREVALRMNVAEHQEKLPC